MFSPVREKTREITWDLSFNKRKILENTRVLEGLTNKLEFIARIVGPDGQITEKTVTSYDELPSLDDFDLETREGFLRDMDKLEKSILSARNEIGEAIAEEYLDKAFKKNL